MAGYTKNIAIIRELKSGFSADGGPLSGLVRAERYGTGLRVEVSRINFAPLSEGRLVCAISDGLHIEVFDGDEFEGTSLVETGAGFAALICFVNGSVNPIASAICGGFQSAAIGIKEEIERQEAVKKKVGETAQAYEDEALAEVNYYEFDETYKNGGAVRENKKEKKDGRGVPENEKTYDAVGGEQIAGRLARGNFFDLMKDEIEKVLSAYPREESLESTVEDSRWVRIDYGSGKFYVFGVMFSEGLARYICYGVPAVNKNSPPESMRGRASFIPAGNGFWVMYQDAATGASVTLEYE